MGKEPGGTPPDDLSRDLHVSDVYEHVLEHPEPDHNPISDGIDKFIKAVGHVACWLNVILVGVIIAQVVLRYGFSGGMIVLEELQWHLYGAAVLFGLSYAMVNDSHIRVDVLSQTFSERTRRKIEIVGILVLLMPFLVIVIDHGIDFAAESFRVQERSDAPLGLPARWIIKSIIPIGFGLLALAAISKLLHNIHALREMGRKREA